jgi:hypothetical protein
MRSMHPFRRHGVRAFLPVCVILLAASAPACSGGGEEQPSAQAIVARAASATQAEKRFHFVFDEKNGPHSTTGVHLVFAEGDIAVPDKVKADVSGTLQGVPLRTRLVVAGGKYYITDPFTGKWREVSINLNPVAFFDPAKGVLAVIEDATQLELVGSEEVSGVNAYHVKGKTTLSSITPLLGNPPGTRLVDVELWVDQKTDRLVRLRLSGEVQEGDPADAVRTIELSRFGVVVPIAAPQTGA